MAYTSPCVSCGACCAFFRVSFHWAELQSAGGAVPDEWTTQVSQHRNCMAGTHTKTPRCTALAGEIGQAVSCTLYNDRPSPCREFSSNADSLVHNADCDRARAHYGLPPLTYMPASDVA